MKPATFTILLAIAVACGAPVFAHDMGEMGDMDMSRDSSSMTPGEMDAMSSRGHSEHDAHLSNMKNMALHMDWTPERPATEADKQRAAALVTTLQKALEK